MLEIITHGSQPEGTHTQRSCTTGPSSSCSSSSSSSPKSVPVFNPQEQKQKSQLCRSYMELGMCPYQSRCKFAHGSHELLKNRQANVKYKTKECDNFRRHLCCQYGNRCNFIHTHASRIEPEPQAKTDLEMLLVRGSGSGSSRLMRLLRQGQI